MTFRVVIPRSIPFGDSNRVQREVWKRGYSTRLAGRDATRPDRLVVEFLRTVEELPDPSEVPAHALALDRLLGGARVHAASAGTGVWIETVQNRPGRRTA
ncbi:hypothetical protein [uncultured Amnibacterium sp.]|uniref:hypothetical protein n=1 Tax=uncultured Amnibacterium sp. TaxID=1631851 RepID=UPI0035CBAB9F